MKLAVARLGRVKRGPREFSGGELPPPQCTVVSVGVSVCLPYSCVQELSFWVL